MGHIHTCIISTLNDNSMDDHCQELHSLESNKSISVEVEQEKHEGWLEHLLNRENTIFKEKTPKVYLKK